MRGALVEDIHGERPVRGVGLKAESVPVRRVDGGVGEGEPGLRPGGELQPKVLVEVPQAKPNEMRGAVPRQAPAGELTPWK